MTDYQFHQLQALADKLGTTAAHLWAVLIVQARIEIWVTCFYVLLGIAIFLFLRPIHRALVRKSNGGGFDSDMWLIPVWIAWGAFAVYVLLILSDLSHIPGLLLNPEYWALKQVLHAVASK